MLVDMLRYIEKHIVRLAGLDQVRLHLEYVFETDSKCGKVNKSAFRNALLHLGAAIVTAISLGGSSEKKVSSAGTEAGKKSHLQGPRNARLGKLPLTSSLVPTRHVGLQLKILSRRIRLGCCGRC